MFKKLLSAALILIALSVTQAHATPFGFAADTGGIFVTQGYQGFNYGGAAGENSWVNDTALSASANYDLMPAPLGAAWSNGGVPLTLTRSTAGQVFNFNSVSLNVGWMTEVTIEGWLNGLLIDTWNGFVMSNPTTYTDLTLNWTGIDEVRFSTGGANLFVTNIDTFLASNDVPEPSTIAIFGLGLLGFAMSRRKSK